MHIHAWLAVMSRQACMQALPSGAGGQGLCHMLVMLPVICMRTMQGQNLAQRKVGGSVRLPILSHGSCSTPRKDVN